MQTSEHHHKLTNGKGKCSVPMWINGIPAGFCDEDSFGEPVKCRMFKTNTGRIVREDGRYNGFVPGLACPAHGGPKCPGVDLGDGNFSGCTGTGGDCPTCGK